MPATTQNTDPIFTGTPKNWMAEINAANADSSGGGVLVTVATAGVGEYLRIDEAIATNAQVTPALSSAMIIHFFVDRGGVIRHVKEMPLAAVTRSNTVIGATNTVTWTNLILEPGDILKVSQSANAGVQDLVHVQVSGGLY